MKKNLFILTIAAIIGLTFESMAIKPNSQTEDIEEIFIEEFRTSSK